MLLSSADFRNRALPIAVSQGVGVICGIAGVKLISRWVPPSVLGIYGVFLTFTTLGMWFVHLGLVKYVGRHWAAEEDKPAFVRAVTRAWVRKLPWLIAATAAGAVTVHLQHGPPGWVIFPLLFAAATFLSIVALAQAALQAERSHWRDLAVSAIGSITRTFAPPLLYLLMGGASLALYLGFAAHTWIVATLAILAVGAHRPISPNASSPVIAPVYEGALFFRIALASWVLTGLNRWLVAFFYGDTAAGYFTLGSSIAVIIPSVLSAMFMQYFQPGFYRIGDSAAIGKSAELARAVDKAAAAFAVSASLALLALRLAAPSLVGPLIDAKYQSALRWILPAGFFSLTTMLAYFYHVMLLASRRETACARVDLTTAALLALTAALAAAFGESVFSWTLIASPLLAGVVTRPMARAALLRDESEAPKPLPVL